MDHDGMPSMADSTTVDGMDHAGMDHSGMMHMYFFFGVTNVQILFKSWIINSAGEMVGACIGVFILAALYEGLKVLREFLLKRSFDRMRLDEVPEQTGRVPLVEPSVTSSQMLPQTMWSSWHLVQTLLHMVQVAVSYALMLIFMSYNGYLAISIIIGAGMGYFVFGWKRAVIVDVNEHCH